MSIDEAISYFNGRANLARALNISYQAVQQWAEAGKIPVPRQFQIQVVTHGALTAETSEAA